MIDMGTQILTTKVIPAHDVDTLGYLFGELVESCDGFAVVHTEYNFQIVQVEGLNRGARPRGSTGRLDRELHQGARLVSSTGRAHLGSFCTHVASPM